ncbi:putative tRNA pseudouridine synthase Pus10 [Carica papaya]|uniref:putative tRNA pseudouridine synthase Pus10 n=1 Tax=Carica papaya TaxID=3649 RepID=UPI000B8CC016|nr:putative tRNA pseudouridine synthase Pus10 [Carica papaya]
MSGEVEVTQVSNAQEVVRATSPSTDCKLSPSDLETNLLNDAVRSLPSNAVKDLLFMGVCVRCVFRLFGIQRRIPRFFSVSSSILWCMLGDKEDSVSLTYMESTLCSLCLGVLQFTYCDDKGMLVKMESANDFAAKIAELVKQEGHQVDSFSIEVSIPPVILENERIVRLHMKKKYESELWFQESSLSEYISAKDAFRCAIADSLETLLGVKSSLGSFRIRLTCTTASNAIENSAERNQGCKRRKTDTGNGTNSTNNEGVISRTNSSGFPSGEGNKFIQTSSNGSQDLECSEFFKLPLEKVKEPCRLVFLCYRMPIYFGGRYLKYSRNVSQTRWIIDEERKGEASVEEIIGGSILPFCQGDSYKFHAAGREDIDVRMLGSGRPFLVEIQNPRRIPSNVVVKEMETKINNLEHKLVSTCLTAVFAFQSTLSFSFNSFVLMQQILQRTPIRVLHRRSPLEREKLIHWMKIERIVGSSQYFLLHLCTQAGTYIKEFVHGDLGRTHPSIGSILGCRAEILRLDVTDVKMDCFLTR